MNPKNFVVVGTSGYVASKHIQAIKTLGHNIVAGVDTNPSGVLDQFSLPARFFISVADMLNFYKDCRDEIDFIVLCSPSYLHYTHIFSCLDAGFNVICEKPICLHKREVIELSILLSKTSLKLYGISQLRLHESVQELRRTIKTQASYHIVDIRYITPRGSWYDESWKGKPKLSGGVGTNIGYHIFDILYYIFGEIKLDFCAGNHHDHTIIGRICNSNFNGAFTISTDQDLKPEKKFAVDGIQLNLQKNVKDLYTQSYQDIFDGKGITLEDSTSTINFCERVR